MGILLLASTVQAAELLAWFPDGPPFPGETAALQISVIDGTAPPTVTAERGVVQAPVDLGDGRWSVPYQAPDARDRLVVTTPGAPVLTVGVRPPQLSAPSLRLSEVTGVAGEGTPLILRVTGDDLPPVADLTVAVAEGRVVSVEAEEGALRITWQPTRDPFARAIPVGVLDARKPDVAPTWGVVRLRGRPRLPLDVEPGASVTVKVGGRSYGPFIANASGQVLARIEVWPGEDTADIFAADALGNVGRTRQALGGDALPRLLGVAAGARSAELPPPRVFLWAIRPDGRPWRGEAPTCFSADGTERALGSLGSGQWSLLASNARLDCGLAGQARTVVVVPVAPPTPRKLQLQVYPTTLTADLPRARVRLFLEDGQGHAMPAESVVVGAGLGEVRLSPEDGALAGEYLGEAALEAGEDTLTAAWSRSPGEGAVWGVEVSATPIVGGVQIAGRARNRDGDPLPGVPVQLTVGNQEVTADTDMLGWATAALLAPHPAVLSVRAGQRGVSTGWRPGQAIGVEPGAPDLLAAEAITIEAGHVREMFLSTDPRVLVAGGGFSAAVEVRLEDRVGRAILGEDVILEASRGRLSDVSAEPDGRYLAIYTPPEDLTAGVVQITASAGEGGLVAATDLRIVPRITRRLTGPTGGWLRGLGTLSSPLLGFEHDWHPERLADPLFLRLTIGGYQDRVEVLDDAVGETVVLDLTVVPVGIGAVARQELRLLTGWLGMAVVAAPYYQETSFAGRREPTASALGLASLPGLQLYGGVGRRLPSGELQAQVGGLILIDGAKDVGWSGFIGGGWLGVGYKFIY